MSSSVAAVDDGMNNVDELRTKLVGIISAFCTVFVVYSLYCKTLWLLWCMLANGHSRVWV